MPSFVWEYFEKLNYEQAQCSQKDCGKIILYRNGTKGMIGHLKSIHNIIDQNDTSNFEPKKPESHQESSKRNEGQSNHKMPSFVWQYFDKLNDEKAQCIQEDCRKIILHRNGTTGLIGHLRSKHNIVDQSDNSNAESKTIEPPKQKCTENNPTKLQKSSRISMKIAKFFLSSGISLSLTESEPFKDLVKTLNSSYAKSLPDSRVFSKLARRLENSSKGNKPSKPDETLFTKCRLCLTQSNSHFTDVSEVRDGFPISVIIMIICPVKITTADSLSEKVCEDCLEIVMSAYKLRDQSITSDRLLRDSVQGHPEARLEEITFVDPLIRQERIEDERSSIVYQDQPPLKDKYLKTEDSDTDESDDFFTSSVVNDQSVAEMSTHKTNNQHSESFICHVCSKVYKRLVQLNSHMAIHDGTKVKCKVCTAEFFSKTKLRRHMLIHNPMHKFRYQCDECAKYFSGKQSLTTHIIRNHKNDPNLKKMHQCIECNRRFWRRHQLNAHIVMHTGEVIS